jgi:hypothetical protein
MRLIFCVLAVFAFGGSAHAEYTGNQLLTVCDNGKEFLRGYVAGFLDKARTDASLFVSHFMRDAKAGESVQVPGLAETLLLIEGYCPQERVSLVQAPDVFCKYLKDNPADRHKPATFLISESLKEVWVCKK